VVTRPLQAERRTGSVRRPKTGVPPTVLRNQPNFTLLSKLCFTFEFQHLQIPSRQEIYSQIPLLANALLANSYNPFIVIITRLALRPLRLLALQIDPSPTYDLSQFRKNTD